MAVKKAFYVDNVTDSPTFGSTIMGNLYFPSLDTGGLQPSILNVRLKSDGTPIDSSFVVGKSGATPVANPNLPFPDYYITEDVLDMSSVLVACVIKQNVYAALDLPPLL